MTATITRAVSGTQSTVTVAEARDLVEPQQVPDTVAAPLTLNELIELTMIETGASIEAVKAFHTTLLAAARRPAEPYHLVTRVIELIHDSILTVVMPDDMASTPGSLHALWEQQIGGDPIVGRPVELVHGKERVGDATFCSVTVCDVSGL